MKFTFFSNVGESLPIASKVAKEGHDVTFILAKPIRESFGTGYVNRVVIGDTDLGDLRSVVRCVTHYSDRTHLVVFDGVSAPGLAVGPAADELREAGYLVLGAGRFQDAIQNSPSYAQGIARVCGVLYPDILIGGLFNGDDWIFHSFYSALQEHHLMAGRVGPKVDLQGEVVWFWRHARPRIVKETLFKLSSFLRKANYRGFVNIIDKSINLQPNLTVLELIGKVGDTFFGMSKGTLQQVTVSYEYAASAFLSLPPYPSGIAVPNIPVFLKGNSFHPIDVMYTEEGGVRTAGQLGRLGYVTATHSDLVKLEEELLRSISHVEAPDLQYRIDIVACRARRSIPVALREVVK